MSFSYANVVKSPGSLSVSPLRKARQVTLASLQQQIQILLKDNESLKDQVHVLAEKVCDLESKLVEKEGLVNSKIKEVEDKVKKDIEMNVQEGIDAAKRDISAVKIDEKAITDELLELQARQENAHYVRIGGVETQWMDEAQYVYNLQKMQKVAEITPQIDWNQGKIDWNHPSFVRKK